MTEDTDDEVLVPMGAMLEAIDEDERREALDAARSIRRYRQADPFPSRLLSPPGLVGEIATWIESCGIRSVPALSLASALSVVATVAGRRYRSQTNLRTNLYVVGLAATGTGKDNARACASSLLKAAGLMKFIGTEEIMSASGLLAKMREHPVRLFALDEFGRMLTAINGTNAGSHQRQIIDTLLKLTGAAQHAHNGSAYAERESTPIEQPHLCLYATSTPDQFWESLSTANASDGFLNRLLIIEHDTRKRSAMNRNPAKRDEPPREITDALRAIGKGAYVEAPRESLQSVVEHMPEVSPLLREVDEDEDAEKIMATVATAVDAKLEGDAPEVWARVEEQISRLAMIVAIGVNPRRPVITGAICEWARDVAWWCATRMDEAIKDTVAASNAERSAQLIMRVVKAAGREGATRSDIYRQTRRLSRRDRDDAIAYLVESGAVSRVKYIGEGADRATEIYHLA